MKADSRLKAPSLKTMRKSLAVTHLLTLQVMTTVIADEDQEAGQDQDHVRDIEVAAEEGLEVGQEVEVTAEAGEERMANWTQLIARIYDARLNIEASKRNERRKIREMNTKVLIWGTF